MFRIGEFSKLCGLSVETLYHYEAVKILVPAYTDRQTGYRYYEASQLITVNRIRALKDAGCSLQEIAKTFSLKPATAELVRLLTDKALSLECALRTVTARLERIHTNIFLLKNGGIPMINEIAVKRVEPILAASIRKVFHKSMFDEELNALWAELNRSIDAAGAKRTVPCMMIYHTGWWDMREDGLLDVEIVEPLVKQMKGSGVVSVQTLPEADRMDCVVHKGPFSTMWQTTDVFFAWIKENGYTLCGPVREIYHKGDWATDDPGEYTTELQAPVR